LDGRRATAKANIDKRTGEFRGFKLRVHRPNRAVIWLLDEWIEENRWKWNEIHVTLEFLFRTRRRAIDFEAWLLHHLVQPRRRATIKVDGQWVPHRLGRCGTSSYGSRRRSRVTAFACYADHRSKMTGQKGCCRLELRSRSARWLHPVMKAAGIYRLSDLTRLNYREFWRQWLQLREIDYAALPKSKCGFTYDPSALMTRLLDAPFARAQVMTHALSVLKIDPRSVMREIDNTPFLPQPTGGLQ